MTFYEVINIQHDAARGDNMRTIDCRGLACPGPVIQAKKALEGMREGESIAMEVDSEASRENVTRFAKSRGAQVTTESSADGASRLVITAGGTPRAAGAPRGIPVVFLASDTLGRGDEKLGRILMEGFVRTLPEQPLVPDKLLLMNSAVRLATDGSPVLDSLRTLADRGCEILACGTCLDFFGLKERLAVGAISNMFDIQGALLAAEKVVRP